MENNKKNYVLARFVKNTKRPHVVFGVYDHASKKIVRKRKYFALSDVLLANAFIKEVNKKLLAGYEYNKADTMSVGEALKFFWENKSGLRRDSVRSYKSHNKQFLEWCQENNLENVPVSKLTRANILAYLDYSMIEKGNIARTRNSKLETLLTILNFLVEREITPKNVASGIKKLREQQSNTQAIPTALVPVIRSLIRSENVTLYLFTSFVYYCFIRPKELLMLEWSNIDMKGGKIFLPAHISKNGKSEHIILPAAMKEILHEHYANGLPTKGNLFNVSYKQMFKAQKDVLAKNDLPTYGLYEWKHTGVTAYFKAGVNIKYIQQQCRHTSLDYTDRYLKGLGLIDNTDAFDDIPRI